MKVDTSYTLEKKNFSERGWLPEARSGPCKSLLRTILEHWNGQGWLRLWQSFSSSTIIQLSVEALALIII